MEPDMFGKVLDSVLAKVEGTLGAVVMGLDGISIEKRISADSANLEALAAEYTSLLKGSTLTTEEVGLGSLQELVITTATRTIVVRMLTPEYFVLALLHKDGNVGRARFELRKAKFLLEKELVI